MLERKKLCRDAAGIVNTEEIVQRNHLLRKIDSAVDFKRIHDFVKE